MKYAVEHFLKAYNWDYQTRLSNLGNEPGQIRVTEFDYKGENHIVYNENGVVVRAWPAIHAGDGPVPAPNNEEGDDPNKWMTKEILSGAWDVSDAEGQMLRKYMKKYKLDPKMFAPKK